MIYHTYIYIYIYNIIWYIHKIYNILYNIIYIYTCGSQPVHKEKSTFTYSKAPNAGPWFSLYHHRKKKKPGGLGPFIKNIQGGGPNYMLVYNPITATSAIHLPQTLVFGVVFRQFSQRTGAQPCKLDLDVALYPLIIHYFFVVLSFIHNLWTIFGWVKIPWGHLRDIISLQVARFKSPFGVFHRVLYISTSPKHVNTICLRCKIDL